MTALHALGVREIATRVEAGSLRPLDLAEALLARIAEREPQVQAWAHLDPQAAREEALAAGAGPLAGVPLGVKDIIDTARLPTECGSPLYAGRVAGLDAAGVALARESGAWVLGKTVTTEFACFQPNKTRNPHDPERTPGGSSSGSAAAVAAGMVPLAFGTQTVGSILRPASFCGVVGYKPTRGLLPLAGIKALAQGLDTLGFFGRSVDCVALATGALSGRGDLAAGPKLERAPRLGWCRTPQWEGMDPAAATILEAAVADLGVQGAEVIEVALPPGFERLVEVQNRIFAFEAARCLAHERRIGRERLSAPLLAVLDEGLALDPAAYDAALAEAESARAALPPVFQGLDALLCPAAPGEAPPGLERTGDPLFNRLWTLLGMPAVSVPGLLGPAGLPLGIQVVAPPRDDARCLAAADWLFRALGGR